MRGHWEEWARLFSGSRERAPGGTYPTCKILRATQARHLEGRAMAFVVLLNRACPLLMFFTEVMGRLDHLVEAVYERFKDRYFPGESLYSPLPRIRSY